MAASGPALSLLLALGFALVSGAGQRRGWPEGVHGVLGYVARLNLVVAAFNLIPALPLDGGRILRAWLWRRQGDLLSATRSGARAGQAFALTLLVVGLLNLWAGVGVMGVWLVVLGGFLLRASSSEQADAGTRHGLEGLTAGDVMASDPGVVLDDTPVARLLDHPPTPERSGYPVLGGGRLLGVVALASARSVPSRERAGRRVDAVMTPLDDVPMVDAADPVLEILDRLNGTNPTGQVVVVDDGCVVGILDEGDVALALDRARPSLASPGEGAGGAGGPGRVGGVGRVGRRAGLAAWVVVAGLCLVTGAALYRPPYVVVSAGPVVDVTGDVSVAGVPVTAVNGRYLVTSVEVRRTSALGTLVAAVRDGRRVVPSSQAAEYSGGANSPGLSRETRLLAAAAAARAQGLPATVAGTGSRVVAVRPGSPAAGLLRAGDVILAVDGRPVTQAGELTELVAGRLPGSGLLLTVDRGGRIAGVIVGGGPGPGPDAGIGITVETRDLVVELPFEVRFAGRAPGGAGAGLAYALAIADLLSTTDLAHGRTIAVAGRVLDAGGHVGPAGGIETRAGAADRAGASLFVVPESEVDGARRAGLQVEGVESLARALEVLSTAV